MTISYKTRNCTNCAHKTVCAKVDNFQQLVKASEDVHKYAYTNDIVQTARREGISLSMSIICIDYLAPDKVRT